jgi:hypothetical protein
MKEYKILVVIDDTAFDLEESLNEVASQGWIVKGVLPVSENRYARIILERDAKKAPPCA